MLQTPEPMCIYEKQHVFKYYIQRTKMSERPSSNAGDRRQAPNTDRVELQRSRGNYTDRGQTEQVNPHSDRDLHYESPTKYDIDYYQRKVNRLQNQLSSLEEELSLTKYRLQKAEDFEDKYENLFKQHQELNEEHDINKQDLVNKTRDANELRAKLDQADLKIKTLQSHIQNQLNSTEQIIKKKEEDKNKASNQGAEERASVEQQYLRQIDNLRQEARTRQDKLKKELAEAQFLISSKENTQKSLKFKLEKIKDEKNQEINRLKEALGAIKTQLSISNQDNDQRVTKNRTQLIEQTENRISQVRQLTLDIENTLLEEINNLNETVAKKDAEISFLLTADKRQIEENEQTQNALKAHILRLQDKIFVIQRENEIQLFNTVDRLRSQYEENISELNRNFDNIRAGHKEHIEDLNRQIDELKKQLETVTRQAKNWEEQHRKVAQDKEISVKMLSQKIIGLEKLKDDDLQNYTTSMRMIEEDAKSKLDDLHTAIMSKNSEFQILNAQIRLKNGEITHLLEEISDLRDKNRQKMRQLQTTNLSEQNALNELINSYKKQVLELKRRNHELTSEMFDAISQERLKCQLLREELNAQKDANTQLNSRNEFLVNWCKEIDSSLKKERISNVDILHDHTSVRRETIQMREQVKVELEAIKEREVEQIRNVFKLEKGRLESDLVRREQEVNSLKAENNRLLVEYKNLERKVGKPSKLERGAEEEGKCKATLEAEIKLTENIFNAINMP